MCKVFQLSVLEKPFTSGRYFYRPYMDLNKLFSFCFQYVLLFSLSNCLTLTLAYQHKGSYKPQTCNMQKSAPSQSFSPRNGVRGKLRRESSTGSPGLRPRYAGLSPRMTEQPPRLKPWMTESPPRLPY